MDVLSACGRGARDAKEPRVVRVVHYDGGSLIRFNEDKHRDRIVKGRFNDYYDGGSLIDFNEKRKNNGNRIIKARFTCKARTRSLETRGSVPFPSTKLPPIGIHYRGVQWEGGAVDGGSTI